MASPAPSPLVSIVVPAYNSDRYLRESLDSILGQTYEPVEVIVLDDASTDGTSAILDEYAKDNSHLTLIRQAVNIGIFANLNDGIAAARGTYVAFYHSDDVYDARIVAEEVAFLERNPEVGAVFTLDTFIGHDGRDLGRLTMPADIPTGVALSYADVLNGFLRHQNAFVRGETSLVRRAVYEEVGPYDDSYLLRADLDMWLRIARHAPIAILNRYLVRYRSGHDNSSRRYATLRVEPEIFFTIIDRWLALADHAVTDRDAVTAYEAHRAEDWLLVGVNRYIAGDLQGVSVALDHAPVRRIVASRRIQRFRLAVLWLLLHALSRLPRLEPVASLFSRRWHIGTNDGVA